jgi:hypothetical protein
MNGRGVLALVLGGTMASGCSTLLHGPTQSVRIESTPPGAEVTITPQTSQRGPTFLIEGDQKVRTPATVELRRDTFYRLEFQKEGYKIGDARLRSEYDWLNAPVIAGPFEAVGSLPRPDVTERALPIQFLTACYTYPVGAFAAIGSALQILSPEAILGHAYKLKTGDDGFFDHVTGLGTPVVRESLERID